jgi:hypothetical protein
MLKSHIAERICEPANDQNAVLPKDLGIDIRKIGRNATIR